MLCIPKDCFVAGKCRGQAPLPRFKCLAIHVNTSSIFRNFYYKLVKLQVKYLILNQKGPITILQDPGLYFRGEPCFFADIFRGCDLPRGLHSPSLNPAFPPSPPPKKLCGCALSAETLFFFCFTIFNSRSSACLLSSHMNLAFATADAMYWQRPQL